MADLETDYLIQGSGAVGLAFADVLLSEDPAVQLCIVDRDAAPGGHWNHAYRFVTLHQPSAFYGVNSLPLGAGRHDRLGPNAGMLELASGAEVAGYFDAVMHRQLLDSGRVRYLPLTEHLGGGRLRHLPTGQPLQVRVRRRIVDAAYHAPAVPALRAPRFACEDDVRVLAPHALAHPGAFAAGAPPRICVIGAGKTGADTVLWLQQVGVPADRISWVMPRDAWWINRLCTQPDPRHFEASIGGQAAQVAAMADAQDVADLLLRMEAAGVLHRLDRGVAPTMFHYATTSVAEMDSLRAVGDVIRMGRVLRVDRAGLHLAAGHRPMPPGTLYVDCSASAVEPRPMQPIFQDGRIVPQLVRVPQPTFSAAFIAHIELTGQDDVQKNRLCQPVPFPDRPEDWPLTLLANMRNEGLWAKEPGLRAWISASRLDGFRKLIDAVDPGDTARMAILGQMRSRSAAAVGNLQRLVAQAATGA